MKFHTHTWILLEKHLCGGSNEKWPPKLICLNTWASVSGTVWEGLGGVALLEEVHHRVSL